MGGAVVDGGCWVTRCLPMGLGFVLNFFFLCVCVCVM